VLDAASLLVNRRARRAKTDRLDAAGLLRTLMALERGEAQVCRVVHVPTPAQEDARRRSRERARLIVERGQHTSRIKGLLMTQGIRDFEPTRRDWPARFEALRTPDGLPLAPCLRAELWRECRRLWLVMEMIAEVEAEQKAVAEAEDGPAARLTQLRGIGLMFATVLGNEVFFRDFRNRREVGGYLGLAPSPWQSGAVRRDQGIATSGNPRARRTVIELAWLWLRHQPGSALTRWFHERVGSSKGPDAPDYAGCHGPQADCLVVALRDGRPCARGRRAEALTEFAAAGSWLLATRREGRGPVSPRARMPTKRWVPLSRPRMSHARGMVVRPPSRADRIQGGAAERRPNSSEADPDFVQQTAFARRR
jgi:transposase